MPKKKWSEFNRQQLGRYGELFAMMEYMSYGYEIYTPEVDDHGVDFLAIGSDGVPLAIQVKSVRNFNYTYVQKNKIELDEKHFVAYVRFADGCPPKLYIIPATVWKTPNQLFVDYEYGKEGQVSKPEYGISMAASRLPMLEEYNVEKMMG